MNNEFSYLFSQEHADRSGYMVAQLEDGSTFKYTRAILKSSSNDKQIKEYSLDNSNAKVVFSNPNAMVYGSPFVTYTNEKPYIAPSAPIKENKNDFTYLFSQEHADRSGYMVGQLEDGTTFKYTRAISNSSSNDKQIKEYHEDNPNAKVVFNDSNAIVYGSPFTYTIIRMKNLISHQLFLM